MHVSKIHLDHRQCKNHYKCVLFILLFIILVIYFFFLLLYSFGTITFTSLLHSLRTNRCNWRPSLLRNAVKFSTSKFALVIKSTETFTLSHETLHFSYVYVYLLYLLYYHGALQMSKCNILLET